MDSNLLNFNGLYVSRSVAFHGYRFFNDGTVLSNFLLNKKEKVTQSIISEQSHSMKGTYSLNGDEISMHLTNGKNDEQLNGRLSGNKLIISYKGKNHPFEFSGW